MSKQNYVLLSSCIAKNIEIELVFDDGEIIRKWTRFAFPRFLWHDYLIEKNCNFASTKRYILKRTLKRFLKGIITNTKHELRMNFFYKKILLTEEDLSHGIPITLRNPKTQKPLWISRNAITKGVSPYKWTSSLEAELVTHFDEFDGFVWDFQHRLNLATIIHTHNLPLVKPNYFSDSTTTIQNTNSAATEGFGYVMLENSQVIRGKIVVHEGKIVQQTDSGKNLGVWPSEYILNVKLGFAKFFSHVKNIKYIDEAIFVGSHTNLFHFLYENCTRLDLILQNELHPKTILVSDDIPENLVELLELIYPFVVEKVGLRQTVITKKLWLGFDFGFTGFVKMDGRETVFVNIRRRILQNIEVSDAYGSELLFLQRPAKSMRKLRNQKEVTSLLQDFKIVSVSPENISYTEQVQLFRNARLVIAESGAAMSNILFCSEWAKVIELQPPGSHSPTLWQDLSRIVGVEHRIINGAYKSRLGRLLNPNYFYIRIQELGDLLNQN